LHFFGHALIRHPCLSSAFRAVRGAPALKMLRLLRQIFAIWLFTQFAFCIKILVIAVKSFLYLILLQFDNLYLCSCSKVKILINFLFAWDRCIVLSFAPVT